MTTTAPFSPKSETAALLGEIVTWEITGIVATQDGVRAALAAAGLDPALCRDLNSRSAFIRGIRHLTEKRIVRRIDEDGDTMRFQFTAEARLPGRLEYLYEAVMTFTKSTQTITCPDKPELEGAAREHLHAAFAARSSNDVTNLVQKIFDTNGDLFPIRNQGGAYFVPHRFADLVEKVDAFVAALGGNFRRFPVPDGYVTGAKAVKQSVAEALAGTLNEYTQAIDDFDMSEIGTRRVESMALRVQKCRLKIEGYAAYLADEATVLLQQADEVKTRLARKVGGLSPVDGPDIIDTRSGSVSIADVMKAPRMAPAAPVAAA